MLSTPDGSSSRERTPAAHDVHVLTLPAGVPARVADLVLTSVESALVVAGATRIWLDTGSPREVAVMARLPVGRTAAPASPDGPDSGTYDPAGTEPPRA